MTNYDIKLFIQHDELGKPKRLGAKYLDPVSGSHDFIGVFGGDATTTVGKTPRTGEGNGTQTYCMGPRSHVKKIFWDWLMNL